MKLTGKITPALLRLSMKGLKRGAHITRYSMYRTLSEVGEQLPNKEGDVLSISHSKILCDVLGIKPKTFFEVNYPEGDMLSLQYPDNSFDYVFSDQVLEHVKGDPQKAINESWRILRKGGIAVHTTCFINPIHSRPGDYWRFTPDGLRLLSVNFSKIISCAGWGNFDVWWYVQNGLRYEGVPHASWHPMHRVAVKNDSEWPIVTWVVAEK